MPRPKILITGSSGTIGKIVTDTLQKSGYDLTLLDKLEKTNPTDLLNDDISKYFRDIGIVIHLAAHVSPFIAKDLAEQNIEMCRHVIEACESTDTVTKVIYASSVNVYPYFEMYKMREPITRKTPLSPNLRFPPGEYAKAKIECESMFEDFCRRRNISLVSLRLGHVTPDDNIPRSENISDDEVENMIFLRHADLRKVIIQGIAMQGINSFVCVSKKSWLFSEDVRFLL